MALIEWNESFSVGVSFFDLQHKQLLSMLNELHAAIEVGKGKEALGPTLQRLSGYWMMHFTAEEAKMKEFDYPDIEAHKTEHLAFTIKLQALKDKSIAGKDQVPEQTLNFLKDWFVTHISVTDMKFKDFFRSKGVH